MIARSHDTATIFDFAAVCNPEVKEMNQLQIGMLKNFPSLDYEVAFEF